MTRLQQLRTIVATIGAALWPLTAQAAVCQEAGASVPFAMEVKYQTGVQSKVLYTGSYALIVGADKYHYWNPLPAVARERDDLRDALVAQGFRVRVICDPQAQGVGGLEEVERFIDQYANGLNRVLIFLSGHGWVDQQEHSGYFAAIDSPQPSVRIEARSKGLNSDAVIALARRSQARHLMFVIDACYSAAIFTSKGGDPLRRTAVIPSLVDYEELSKPSRQFLTAGSDDQQTPSPSIFTPAFIMGISGYADTNNDGIVRESELSPWLRLVVANSTGRATTPRAGYIPASRQEISTGGGEMVFRYVPSRKAGAAKLLSGGGAEYLSDLDPPVPVSSSDWPDPRYRISYFAKPADEGVVIRALEEARVPYLTMTQVLAGGQRTNGLACHPATPAEVVRAAARALIDGGVRLRIIDRITRRLDAHRYVLQTLEFARVRDGRYRDITVDDLATLTGCPNDFSLPSR